MPPEVVDACLRFLESSDIPDHRHHRRRAGAASALPRHRPPRPRRRPPRDGPVQPDDHAPAELRGPAGVSRGAPRRGRRVAAVVFRAADRTRSAATACSPIRSRRCGGSTSWATASRDRDCCCTWSRIPSARSCRDRRRRSKPTGNANCSGATASRFNRLYTITNMPISRFLQFLIDSGNLQGYMDRLDRRVQSRGGRRADVPVDAVGGLGRAALRLRLQPDARPRHRRRSPADDLRRHARIARRPPHRRRAALLRLHRRRRLELRRCDDCV